MSPRFPLKTWRRLAVIIEQLAQTSTSHYVIATHNEMLIERFGYARMVLDKGMLQHLPRNTAATRIA